LVRDELNLEKVYLLKVTNDGRFFCCYKDGQEITWLVSDFNHPFSHVIHSSSSMVLKNNEILYWLSDKGFNTLVEPLDQADKIAIVPLMVEGIPLQAMLVIQGREEEAIHVVKNDSFLQFITICASHFDLLNDVENRRRNSHQLIQTLDEAKKDKKKKNITAELSNILIGHSNEMKKLREQVVKAASTNLSVMVQGETGTGKELVSRAVHDLSQCSNAEFIAINCAAIPEHLLESELFGYVKGAFSGADANKKGLLADADGGTLFLDEIGDMPLGLQAKLLRVLESQQYRPIGAKKELSSNFRLVVATHVNLKEKVLNNEFRKDLYYRIYQYPILLPPLSTRKSDIEKLSEYFINQYNESNNSIVRGLDYKALDYLLEHSFPGNVRELKHLIQYGCAQTPDGKQIETAYLLPRLDNINNSIDDDVISSVSLSGKGFYVENLKNAIRDYEINIISSRLKEFEGDRAKTAESLGIPKRTLADKCLKLEIVFDV
jgi:sigma-54-specific transcriptional regulator